MIELLFLSAALTATPPLVGVDLSKAILQSTAGRSLQAELASERDQIQAEVNVRRQRLLGQRESLSPPEFEAAVEAFNRFIDQRESGLQARQEKALGPITAAMEAQVDLLRGRGFRVLDVPQEGRLGLPGVCDATAAVAESKASVFTAPKACQDRRVVRVDVGRALAGSAAAERTTAALDQLKAQRQGSLDEMRRALASASPKARPGLKAQLDERFRAYQAEIRKAEQDAEANLRRRLVEAIGKSRPSSVVVVLGKKGDPCDATEAASAALAGRSFAEALARSCPTDV
ncbi:MAG: hypothetical protein AAGJ19_19190 [Myxococcota bacterium]